MLELELVDYTQKDKEDEYKGWRSIYNSQAQGYNQGVNAKSADERARYFFDKLDYLKRWVIPNEIMPRVEQAKEKGGRRYQKECNEMVKYFVKLLQTLLQEDVVKINNDELARRKEVLESWKNSTRPPINVGDYIEKLPREIREPLKKQMAQMKNFTSTQFLIDETKPTVTSLFEALAPSSLTPAKNLNDSKEVAKYAKKVVESTKTSFEEFKANIKANKGKYGIASVKEIEKNKLEIDCFENTATKQGSLKVYAEKMPMKGGVSLSINAKQENMKLALDRTCMLAVQTAAPGETVLTIPSTLPEDLKALAYESLKHAVKNSGRKDISIKGIKAPEPEKKSLKS